MARKSAPLYNWQIEVQEGEQKSKKVFLEKYSKEIATLLKKTNRLYFDGSRWAKKN